MSLLAFTPKKLSLLIAVVLGSGFSNAYAALINYNIQTQSGYAIGQSNPLTNSTSNSDAVSSYTHQFFGDWSSNPNTRGSASGNNQGWMYSTAGGQGSYFTHYSVVTQNVRLKNDSAFDQNFNYNFIINQGSLTAVNYAFTEINEFSKASYEVEIALNNVALWQSSFSLLTVLSGSGLTGSGTSLNTYFPGSEYFSWGEYIGNLNLGQLNAGEYLDLSYRIKTSVSGNHKSFCMMSEPSSEPTEMSLQSVINDEDCSGYGEYGEYGYQNFSGDTYAQFGDPNTFTGTPIFSNDNIVGRNVTAQVSTPASLALLGLGLAGLAFRRRQTA